MSPLTAGWEVEGFIDRITRRDDTNSERLTLEAISHLRAFSRDCNMLRDDNRKLRDEIERLRSALKRLVDDIHDYEQTNKLAPNPPRMECWDSVAEACRLLDSTMNDIVKRQSAIKRNLSS